MFDYTLLKKELESLTDCFSVKLPEQDLSDLKEYIYHGEYGLAFELLCDSIIQNKLSVYQKTYEDIVRIGQLMKFEPDTWNQINCVEDM